MRSNKPSRLVLVLLLVAAVAGSLAATAAGATFKVNKRGDHAPGPCTADDCTLREAVIAATAAPGSDKITLPSRKPYRLKRDIGLPAPDEVKGDLDFGLAFALGNDFKLVHPGPGKAKIDAEASGDRAIEVKGNLELAKVVVRGGHAQSGSEAGGGIRVTDGVMIMRKSRVTKNAAPDVGGGVAATQGALIIRQSVIEDNEAGEGGGVFIGEEARLNLSRSTVAENRATSSGGGVSVWTAPFFGTSRLTSSTVAHNEADGDGGGVYTRANDLRVDNSTLTKNRATARGGGIYAYPDSDAQLNGVTIVRNRADSDDSGAPDFGGGIFTDGGSDVVEMRNSLLAKNKGTGGAVNECDAPAPVGIASLGGNLLTSTAGGCDFFTDPEDVLAGNPGIGPLAANGGPTQTIALKAASPAIDEADGPTPRERDQRGVLRSDPDIGAYER